MDLAIHLTETRAEYERRLELLDQEETNNGDTEYMDLMQHELQWWLADRALEILYWTGEQEVSNG